MSRPVLHVDMKDIVQEYPRPLGGGTVRVLDDISLSITQPGVTMILGPSGCGKSTLMRMAGGVRPYGVVTPTSGTVLLGGAPCDEAHNDAVMVFQSYANRPDLTVYENVFFPFRLKSWAHRKSEAKTSVMEALKDVGLAEKKDLYPHQLSGGQNQRVALARALVLKPRLLLMDEPFGALDAQTRVEMQTLLLRLVQSHPAVVLFVTHDVTEALMLGDRVIVLSTGPAKIVDDFQIVAAHPRQEWLAGAEAGSMRERILTRLHAASVRISV